MLAYVAVIVLLSTGFFLFFNVRRGDGSDFSF